MDLLEAKPIVFVALDEFVKALTKSLEDEARVLSSVLLVHKAFVKKHEVMVRTTLLPQIVKDLNLDLSTYVIPFH